MQTTCLCSAPFPPFLHWNKKDSSGFISIEIHFLYHIVLPIVLSRNIFCVPNQAEKFRHSTQLHIYSNFFKFLQISANMISPTSPKLKQVSTINSDIRSGRRKAQLPTRHPAVFQTPEITGRPIRQPNATRLMISLRCHNCRKCPTNRCSI